MEKELYQDVQLATSHLDTQKESHPKDDWKTYCTKKSKRKMGSHTNCFR